MISGFLLICPTRVRRSQGVFKVLVVRIVSSFITSDDGILRVFFDYASIFRISGKFVLKTLSSGSFHRMFERIERSSRFSSQDL